MRSTKTGIIGLAATLLIAACWKTDIATVSGTFYTPTPQGGRVGVPGIVLEMKGGPRGAAGVMLSTTDADGRYQFGAVPGIYSLPYVISTGYTIVGAPAGNSYDLHAGATLTNQDYLGTDPTKQYAQAQVMGTASSGIEIDFQGAVSLAATTDDAGLAVVGPLPPGAYTMTPQPSPWSSFPSSVSADGGISTDFVLTPKADPGIVTVTGDQAAGIDGGTFPTVPGYDSMNPVPGVALYDAASNSWTFSMYFAPLHPMRVPYGSSATYQGMPAAGQYTQAQELQEPTTHGNFSPCWFGPQGEWDQRDYLLTITSVGQPAPATAQFSPGAPVETAVEYPIHGTLHVDCALLSNGSGQAPPDGGVWVDVTF